MLMWIFLCYLLVNLFMLWIILITNKTEEIGTQEIIIYVFLALPIMIGVWSLEIFCYIVDIMEDGKENK